MSLAARCGSQGFSSLTLSCAASLSGCSCTSPTGGEISMMVALLELSPEEFEVGGFCFDLAAGSACVESCERGGGELTGGDCATTNSDMNAISAARIAGLSDIISILANGALARAPTCSARGDNSFVGLYCWSMARSTEIEIKFRVRQLEALAEKLRQSGF